MSDRLIRWNCFRRCLRPVRNFGWDSSTIRLLSIESRSSVAVFKQPPDALNRYIRSPEFAPKNIGLTLIRPRATGERKPFGQETGNVKIETKGFRLLVIQPWEKNSVRPEAYGREECGE